MRLASTILLLLSFGLQQPARGLSITGADWIVHINLPDQNAGGVSAEEYAIRDALIGRLAALQTGHVGRLATYTWSASNAVTGAAGPLLNAMEAALNRGARLEMAVDGGVPMTQRMGGSNSLAGLAARAVNPLVLVADDSASGIMHHKLGLFDYGSNRWLMAGSWNFTQAAGTFQWNVMIELRHDAAWAAYTNEFAELRAGRFHDHAAKSHAHDRTAFRLAGSWTNDWVRFAPYPDDAPGGTNALTDVTNVIGQAATQIAFALNQITRLQAATALVAACDRGVEVLGVIPLSDATNASSSLAVYQFLTNAASYATTNRVRFLTPFERADGGTVDDGSESDLVHAKWLVADPFGPRPVAIIGSANWTDAALVSESSNDENLLFLHDGGIARALYAHLKRMTRDLNDRADFLLTGLVPAQLTLRPTDTNFYLVEQADGPAGGWTNLPGVVTGVLSGVAVPVPADGTTRVFRIRRAE